MKNTDKHIVGLTEKECQDKLDWIFREGVKVLTPMRYWNGVALFNLSRSLSK